MPRRVERTRKNDPLGTRRKVLDVAARAFQRTGYSGTSMQDIVRDAAVSGGALHHHFPSKKDLGLAVIAERVAAEVEATWIATVRAAPTAADGILQVFDEVAAQLEEAAAVSGCPLGNLALELSLADDDFRTAIAREYGAWRAAIAERLRADLARGQAPFAAGDAEGFADAVVAMFTGAMSIAKAEQRTTALRSCERWLRRVMAPAAS